MLTSPAPQAGIRALPSLHPVCADHAVLLAAAPVLLGTAGPGAPVRIAIAGITASAVADPTGRWRIVLQEMPAGGPHRLTVATDGGSIQADDLWFGDVWLGSGQSNMEWTIGSLARADALAAELTEPRVRILTVPRVAPVDGSIPTAQGRWEVVDPARALGCSAVATYFAQALVRSADRPVGVVVSAWGGSMITGWIPEPTLRAADDYRPVVEELDRRRQGLDPVQDVPHADPGIATSAAGWMSPDLDDDRWPTLGVPGQWQPQGWQFNGAVWYRTSVQVPEDWRGRDLVLDLGVVDDWDTTWVDGVQVGATGGETASWWTFRRSYRIPASGLATRVVAIRVFDLWGEGGLLDEPVLRPADEPEHLGISLSGLWRARAELPLPLRAPGGGQPAPGALFQGMIAPLAGISLSGILWYQGESDVHRAQVYRRYLTDLIASWRDFFADPELPFGIVSLASYLPRRPDPGEDPWADLRESQRRVAAAVPRCGLVVAIDCGEAGNIHPQAKQPIGERLARWALYEVHGRTDQVPTGPEPVEAWNDGDAIRIRFRRAEGLTGRSGPVRGFQLGDAAGRWVWADAGIDGEVVAVVSHGIHRPVAVRYAWQANPEASLINAAGLPAGPFAIRTQHPGRS